MSPDPTDSCTDFQPRLAAYALGEAEADEELLAHLADCPACQRDLRAYVQVARMLPYDAPDVAPPPELRARILAAVEEPSRPPQPAAPDTRAEPPRPAPIQKPTRPWAGWRPARWAAFALAAAAFLALLGWNIALQNQLGNQTVQLALNRENWRTMIVLLNDPAVHWYAVAGAAAKGHVWAAPHGQAACLVAQELPALAANQVYQVWLIHGAERTNGGVFEARDGNGWILIRVAEPLANYDSVGVTVEPRGGSVAPTGPQVLQGTLAAAQAPTLSDRQGLLRLVALMARRDN